MKWLITGGCGFIGKNLIQKLMESPENSIRVVDNLSVGTRQDLNWAFPAYIESKIDQLHNFSSKSVELVVADIMDADSAIKLTRGADVIVHLAANTGVGPSVEDPRSDCMTNVIGTFNYLEGARENNVSRFVFASSGAPIGECVPPIHEEMAAHPVSPYGASKLAGEGYCSVYKQTYGINTVALRFGNVYGPGSTHKSSVVAKFIRRAMAGKVLEIYGDGSQTRDFIFLFDLIDAIYKAATVEKVGGEVFQIATNKETTVSEMLELLVDVMKESGFPEVRVIKTEARLGDVMRNFSDISKAKKVLGWEAKWTLKNGLHKTMEFFQNS